MTPLPESYNTAAIEKKWQAHWLARKIYAWDKGESRENSYVIDTPPPTVSGVLHMGHVFSYTQADFIARFQRMNGKNVFYPMGFDDNGLPTERLVEKTKKIRAVDMSREEFIKQCLEISEEARKEFRALFESIALSVDWAQEYHTISDDSRRLSQLSFLDLVQKGHAYRELRPFYWDPVDQTAIAQAEIVDKEMPGFQNIILFEVDGKKVPVMTTRPELIPACVALMCHPDDAGKYKGKKARTPLFNIEVPIIADEKVDKEKGTGLVMCCTFGDDTDIQWWQKYRKQYDLPTRVILNKYGKLDLSNTLWPRKKVVPDHPDPKVAAEVPPIFTSILTQQEDPKIAEVATVMHNKKVSNSDPKHPGAREIIAAALKEANLLTGQTPITHAVKCAERSGAPLEILPTHQWFVRVLDKKDALKKKSKDCKWHPEWMQVRMEQWIDGLNQDWCISRQRYFGVPFPVWYVEKWDMRRSPTGGIVTHVHRERAILAHAHMLPINPLTTKIPPGFKALPPEEGEMTVTTKDKEYTVSLPDSILCEVVEDIYSQDGKELWFTKGEKVIVKPDADVMDTWATSSISPQLSAGTLHPHPPAGAGPSLSLTEGEGRGEGDRFSKLYPADLRPQAHEIIRTWAFYTLVKAYLHAGEERDEKDKGIPWHNLMISGWCLAEDKTKMSKSKGNVVTPVALIEEKGTDAVRYWAGTSRLGADTAFSPDLLKIGKKLVTKLWNATQFAAIHLNKLEAAPTTPATDSAVTEILDQWILTRLGETVARATTAFSSYEYADALDATNQFFWADFCDNYLELIKKRVYNEDGSFTAAQQQSAVRALYYCLNTILKLYAPFIPHVTEELYSHIFADEYTAKGSLHVRGTWPMTKDYPKHTAVTALLGMEALNILEHIRSRKSDEKRSIKTPVTSLELLLPIELRDYAAEVESMLRDIEGAGNVLSISRSYTEKSGTTSQVTRITFSKADAA